MDLLHVPCQVVLETIWWYGTPQHCPDCHLSPIPLPLLHHRGQHTDDNANVACLLLHYSNEQRCLPQKGTVLAAYTYITLPKSILTYDPYLMQRNRIPEMPTR